MCYQAPYLDFFHGEELDVSTASARLIIPMMTETKISMILIAQTLPGCNPQISSLRGRRKWASLVGVFVKKKGGGGQRGSEKGQEGRLFLGQRARCGHHNISCTKKDLGVTYYMCIRLWTCLYVHHE